MYNKLKRPMFLNLFQIKFPLAAQASILHRLSGVLLFFLIPFLLYYFEYSLTEEDFFNDVKFNLHNGVGKFITFSFLSLFIYHFFAGIRHLIMDFGYAETVKAGKISAALTMIITAILIICCGIWLW